MVRIINYDNHELVGLNDYEHPNTLAQRLLRLVVVEPPPTPTPEWCSSKFIDSDTISRWGIHRISAAAASFDLL